MRDKVVQKLYQNGCTNIISLILIPVITRTTLKQTYTLPHIISFFLRLHANSKYWLT